MINSTHMYYRLVNGFDGLYGSYEMHKEDVN